MEHTVYIAHVYDDHTYEELILKTAQPGVVMRGIRGVIWFGTPTASVDPWVRDSHAFFFKIGYTIDIQKLAAIIQLWDMNTRKK